MLGLKLLDQGFDPHRVRFAVTVAADRIWSAAGLNVDVGKHQACVDLDLKWQEPDPYAGYVQWMRGPCPRRRAAGGDMTQLPRAAKGPTSAPQAASLLDKGRVVACPHE